MKIKSLFIITLISLIFVFNMFEAKAQNQQKKVRVSLEKRELSNLDTTDTFKITNYIRELNPSETAIIICDIWDQHWCKDATARVSELAPKINNVIKKGREKGMLIVHAPSDCMSYYKDYPQRRLAQKYKNTNVNNLISNNKLPSEKNAVWPIDDSDGGCTDLESVSHNAWTKQNDAIIINDKDAISDNGVEIAGLFRAKGIKNVILMGVHTNMCVIGRSFGLRNMVRLGMNVVLMRDLTDAMYDSRQWPYVSHFTGVSLIVEYIEKYVCPTLLSSDFTSQKQFRFKNDNRPIVAFITDKTE